MAPWDWRGRGYPVFAIGLPGVPDFAVAHIYCCGEIDQRFTCRKQGTKKSKEEEIVIIPGARNVSGTWKVFVVAVVVVVLIVVVFTLLRTS